MRPSETTEKITQPLVSVVIPARNAELHLARQLRALSMQETEIPFEVVVAENGSTDLTWTVASSFVPTFSEQYASGRRLVVADASEKAGINFARNRGVQASSGDIVLLCDADDQVDSYWVANHYRAYEMGADCTSGGLRQLLPDGTLLSASDGDFRYPGVGLRHAVGANCGFRRRVFDKIGGFDERYLNGSDEIDFYWRAGLLGYDVVPVPDAVVNYYTRGAARQSLRQHFRYGLGDYQLMKSYATLLPVATPSVWASLIRSLKWAVILGVAFPSRKGRVRAASRAGLALGSLFAGLRELFNPSRL